MMRTRPFRHYLNMCHTFWKILCLILRILKIFYLQIFTLEPFSFWLTFQSFFWSFTWMEKSLVICDIMNFSILMKIPFLLLMSWLSELWMFGNRTQYSSWVALLMSLVSYAFAKNISNARESLPLLIMS